MELGAGLAYVNPRLGLDIATRARMLAVHRDEHFREWGANVSVRRLPANPDRGLSVLVEPAWGKDASGVTALWEGRMAHPGEYTLGLRSETAVEAWRPDRLEMEVSYGTDLAGRASLKPFGRMRMIGADSRHLRVGTRLEMSGEGEGGRLQLELLGEQRVRAGGVPDYGATLTLASANREGVGQTFAPFGELSYVGAGQRMRVGTQLLLANGGKRRTVLPGRLRLEVGGEAYGQPDEPMKFGLFLRGGTVLDWR